MEKLSVKLCALLGNALLFCPISCSFCLQAASSLLPASSSLSRFYCGLSIFHLSAIASARIDADPVCLPRPGVSCGLSCCPSVPNYPSGFSGDGRQKPSLLNYTAPAGVGGCVTRLEQSIEETRAGRGGRTARAKEGGEEIQSRSRRRKRQRLLFCLEAGFCAGIRAAE